MTAVRGAELGVRVRPVLVIPRVRCGAVNGGRIPGPGVGELNMWKSCPFSVCEGAQPEVRKAPADVQGKAVA